MSAATTIDVEWNFNQVVSPASNKRHSVDITAMFPVTTDGHTIIVGTQTNRYYTDTNNLLSISNVILPGFLYRLTYTPTADSFFGARPVTFTNLFPTTLTNHEFVDGGDSNYIVSAVYGLIPISDGNSVFLLKSGGTGSNETFVGSLKLPVGSGQVGYVWTMTNAATGAGEYQPAPGGGSGSGDVNGPASSTAGNLAYFFNTTGKLLADSGIPFANVVLQAGLNTVSNQLVSAAQTIANTSSNSVLANAQTAINVSSNSVLANAQSAINSSSNSVVTTGQASVNSSSNSIVGTMQASINITSNSLNGAINTSSNLVYGNALTQINTTSNSLQSQITSGGVTLTQLNATSNSVYGNALTQINTTSNSLNTSINTSSNSVFANALSQINTTSNTLAGVDATKVNTSTTLTINGTANQITSSAGAQDLSANRTVTLSLPSTLIAPGTLEVTSDVTNRSTVSTAGVSTNFAASYFKASVNVTGGFTNAALTANAFTYSDANKKLASIPVASGFPTNDGSGGFGIYPGDALAKTNNLLPISSTAPPTTNLYAYFNGDNTATNLGATLDGRWWTNTIPHTHEGTTTNITATFNGTLQTFTCTNGPSIGQDYFIHFAGANGSISYRFAGSSYNNLHFDYQPKWLSGSNSVITNGVLSLTSYGGTNAAQIEAAMKENQ